MDAIRSGFVAHLAAPRASAGPPAVDAASPVDTSSCGSSTAVATTGASASTGPWDVLHRLDVAEAAAAVAGTAGAAAAFPGPVAQVLLDVVKRLQAGGVTFERRRLAWIPFLMDRHVPLDAERAATELARGGRVFFSRPPSITLPQSRTYIGQSVLQESHVPIRSLDDLRGLDGVYGAGPQALPPAERAAMEAHAELVPLKWEVGDDYVPASHGRVLFLPYEVWRRVHDGTEFTMVRDQSWDAIQARRNDLLALAMLETGHDRGVEDPDIVSGIVGLREGGVRTMDPARELGLYRRIREGHSPRIGLATKATMGVGREDMGRVPEVLEELRRRDDLYRQYLAGGLELSINRAGDFDPIFDFCAEKGRFSPHVRAAAIRDLVASCSNHHGYLEVRELIALEKRLEAAAGDEFELKLLVEQHAATGTERPSGQPARGADYERLLATFRHLLEGAGSDTVACDGLDLIRMPIRRETEADRIKLLLDLAAARTEKMKASQDYRAVLIHRRPGEDVLEAGAAYVGVLQSLGAARQQDRADEVFSALQAMRGTASGNDAVKAFGQGLAVSGSVDQALAAARKSLEKGFTGASQGITRQGGDLVIGGVRIRRANAAVEEPAAAVEGIVAAVEEPVAAVEASAPDVAQPSEPASVGRKELEDGVLGQTLRRAINRSADFEPLYEYCLEGGTNFSAQTRAEVLSRLMPAHTNHHGYVEVRELIALARRIQKRAITEQELKWLLEEYMDIMDERKGPYGTQGQRADLSPCDRPLRVAVRDWNNESVSTPPEMLDDIAQKLGIRGEALFAYVSTTRGAVRQWKAEQLLEKGDYGSARREREAPRRELKALMRKMEDATKSERAAADGVDLVRIAVGSEPQEDRVRLFLDLAAADGTQAARDYRAVLMYRRPDQDLLDAGRTFKSVLGALQGSERARAIEVFAALQDRGVSAETFGTALAAGSVDGALDAVCGARRGGTIVVGGLPVKP